MRAHQRNAHLTCAFVGAGRQATARSKRRLWMGKGMPTRKLSRPAHLPSAWKELKYHKEHTFNLSEYMVELDQPLGISLAPDLEGQVYVVELHEGYPAAESKVIREGDIVKKCSGAWGDILSDCNDIRHMQWAVRIRKGKVKLLLERRLPQEDSLAPSLPLSWFRWGKNAQVGCYENSLNRPIQFIEGANQKWVTCGKGKSMSITFHRTLINKDSEKSRKSHHKAKAVKTRSQLVDALSMASIHLCKDLSSQTCSIAEDQRWGGLVPPSVVSNSVPYRSKQWREEDGWELVKKGDDKEEDFDSEQDANGKSKPQGNENGGETEVICKMVTPVFPWLFMTNARLSQSDMVDFAGRCGLQSLLELRLEHWKGNLALAGSSGLKSRAEALVTAVGALHRLVTRRQVILSNAENGCSNCSVLIHCGEGMETSVSGLIAAYCFLHGFMAYEESMELTAAVMQSSVPRDLVKDACDFLKGQALERLSSVTVAWRYGGKKVEVAGDLAGGWDHRLSLQKRPRNPSPCQFVPRGTHYIRLTGLEPGDYNYKFITDGNWQVDFLGPNVKDKMGNWNNILQVRQNISALGDLGGNDQDMIRMEAALVAFRTKRRMT